MKRDISSVPVRDFSGVLEASLPSAVSQTEIAQHAYRGIRREEPVPTDPAIEGNADGSGATMGGELEAKEGCGGAPEVAQSKDAAPTRWAPKTPSPMRWPAGK